MLYSLEWPTQSYGDFQILRPVAEVLPMLPTVS